MPTALDACVTATQRVRSDRTASTAAAGSASVPGSGSAKRTTAPARSAAITHGRTLASWSSRVHTTSSPGASSRQTVAAKRMVSAVMLAPNATPAGSAPSRAATAARAPATSSSVWRAAANSPPWLAVRPERMPLGHRLDRRVDHLRAGRAVQPRPAVAYAREALAVHRAALASATSCA